MPSPSSEYKDCEIVSEKKRDPFDFPFLHPFLIAVYLVLSLWVVNIDQTPLFAIARPMAFALVTACVTAAASLLIFRQAGKAAIFASLFLLIFLAYGRVFDFFDMKQAAGLLIGRHRFMVPVWFALFAAGTFLIIRSRTRFAGVNRILNMVSLFLVAMMLGQAGLFWAQVNRSAAQTETAKVETSTLAQAREPLQDRSPRDVYYIVLDAYSRQDVLKEKHGVENGAFLQQLRDLGFTVMDCAQSNYAWTPLSMASSLNMNYIDSSHVRMPRNGDRINFWDFQPLFQRSRVLREFESMGYTTVTFRAIYPWMDIPNSDIYFDLEKTSTFFDRQEAVNFQYLFLRTTAIRLLLEVQERSPERFERLPAPLLKMINPKSSVVTSRHSKQYDQNRYALEQLQNLSSVPGPKFVYAHLFITHQPYTFNLDGSMRWPPAENMEGYNVQVEYANKRMVDILKRIIEHSPLPPVIILQSDHSYLYDKSRVNILNAYYLPDGGAAKLYPSITPVNTFRLVFNAYFEKEYPLLDDISYYSEKDRPYNFETVQNLCLQDPN